MSLDERELKKLWDEELDKEERKIVVAMAKVVSCIWNTNASTNETQLFQEWLNIQTRKLHDIQKKRLCPNERFNEILCKALNIEKDE